MNNKIKLIGLGVVLSAIGCSQVAMATTQSANLTVNIKASVSQDKNKNIDIAFFDGDSPVPGELSVDLGTGVGIMGNLLKNVIIDNQIVNNNHYWVGGTDTPHNYAVKIYSPSNMAYTGDVVLKFNSDSNLIMKSSVGGPDMYVHLLWAGSKVGNVADTPSVLKLYDSIKYTSYSNWLNASTEGMEATKAIFVPISFLGYFSLNEYGNIVDNDTYSGKSNITATATFA